MPTTITITHPANWGAYKKDLLEQAVHLAGFSGPGNPTIRLPFRAGGRSDPLCGHRAGRARPSGRGVRPRGRHIRRGRVALDRRQLRHPRSARRHREAGRHRLRRRRARPCGPNARRARRARPRRSHGGDAVAHLRDQCTAAKEALSVDTQTIVPVMLPGTAHRGAAHAGRARGDARVRRSKRRSPRLPASAAHRGAAALRPQGGRAGRRVEPHPARRAARHVGARSTGRARHRPEAADRARRRAPRAPHRGRAGCAHLAQPPDGPRAVGGQAAPPLAGAALTPAVSPPPPARWPDPSAGAPAHRIDRPTADEWAHPDGASARDLRFVDPASDVLHTAALRAAAERPDDAGRPRTPGRPSASARGCSSALRPR